MTDQEHKPYRGLIKNAVIVANRVYGDLYDSSVGFPDGIDVRTSEITNIDGMIFETRNSKYCVELAPTGYTPEPD